MKVTVNAIPEAGILDKETIAQRSAVSSAG